MPVISIRQRLAFSFLLILAFFGLDLGVYLWSNQRRKASVEDLRQAISSQILIASIHQKLNDIHKQVAVLSQAFVDSPGAVSPEEVARFKGQLDAAGDQIGELQRLSDGELKKEVTAFQKLYAQLSASWLIFYENFGLPNTKAITELGLRADPMSDQLLQHSLPELQRTEARQVETASANFYNVARLADRITVGLFLISAMAAIGVAYLLSRYLTRSLDELKLGASFIGRGQLEHRIEIRSHDELGTVAGAFNDMSEYLLQARSQLTQANQELEGRNKEVEKQKQISDSLLLNILPSSVADELRARGVVEPKYFEDVTILFTDFVGFTLSTEKLAAEDLVHLLHDYFTAFDRITERYGLEKLKTIGDSYMCGGGLPVRNPSHAVDMVFAALEMLRTVEEHYRPEGANWAIRIGVHTGPVVAGVVGVQKFAFDVWGPTVNYASRVESTGHPNRINISEATYSRVKDFFECEYRGKVLTKDKKEADMYFVNDILPGLMGDGTQVPPPAFLRRYHVYFQKEPPSFPGLAARASVA